MSKNPPAEREMKTVNLKVTIEITGEEPREIVIGYPIDLREVSHAATIVSTRIREFLDIALTTSRKNVD